MRTAVQPNHASVVNHLRRDDHRGGRLCNPIAALISRHQRRRAIGDAAFLQWPVLRFVGPADQPYGAAKNSLPYRSLCRLLCHGGQPPVARLRDERGSIFPIPLDRPDGAVIAGLAVGALETRFGSVDIRVYSVKYGVAECRVSLAVEQLPRLLPHRRHFLVGEKRTPL